MVKGIITGSGSGLTVNSPNTTIECNYFGTSADGRTRVVTDYPLRFSLTADGAVVQNNLIFAMTSEMVNNTTSSLDSMQIKNNIVGAKVSLDGVFDANSILGVMAQMYALKDAVIGGNPADANVIAGGNRDNFVWSAGLMIGESSNNVSIKSNYVGISPGGVKLANSAGILIDKATGGVGNEVMNVTIGGTNANDRNYISGNSSGILVGHGTDTVTILGNYIGSGLNGKTAGIGNTDGITYIFGETKNVTIGNGTVGGRNVISGNTSNGINISDAYADLGGINKIQGNYVGLDVDENPLPNNGNGLYIGHGGNLLVGGSSPGEGNIISGNNQGISISENAAGITFFGNMVGVKSDGETAAPNTGWRGADIRSRGTLQFGGPNSGEGNIVSCNKNDGVTLIAVQNFTAQGNKIGVTKSGAACGNGGDGISQLYPYGYPVGSTIAIGGDTAAKGNIIANNGRRGAALEYAKDSVISHNQVRNNGGVGILLSATETTQITHNTVHDNGGTGVVVHGGYVWNEESRTVWAGNSVQQNSIYANGGTNGLGIDIGGQWSANGITANDYQDADTGSNNVQNYPIIKVVMTDCSGVSSERYNIFNSTPNATFTIDYYANPSWTSGPLQGEIWHSSETVTTDANGNGTIHVPTTIANPSATATDASGNTSEFGAITNISFADCSMNMVTNDPRASGLSGSWTATGVSTTMNTTIAVNGQPYDFSDGKYLSDTSFYMSGPGLATPLADGSYDVTMTVTDPATGLTMTHTFVNGVTIDTMPPPAPTVVPLTTNNQRPLLHGTAPGAQYIYIEICSLDATKCYYPNYSFDEATGQWSIADGDYTGWYEDPNNPGTWTYGLYQIPEGVYNVTVVSYDDAGNSMNDSTEGELVIDITAPTGSVTPTTLVSSSPALTGTVDDPTATVRVTVNGGMYTATNNGDGTWTLPAGTIATIATAGTYDVTATFTDTAENTSTDPTNQELTVQVPPSVQPTTWVGGQPIITGTFDSTNTKQLRVNVDGRWYILGEDPQLTSSGNTWRLDLSSLASPLTAGTYSVIAELTTPSDQVLTDVTSAELSILAPTPVNIIANPSNGPLANTGFNIYKLIVGAIGVVIIGISALTVYLFRKKRTV